MSKNLQNSFWLDRIANANAHYKSWEDRFKCQELEEYYENFQHTVTTDILTKPYTVNLVYATIEDRLASLVYNNPEFEVSSIPKYTEFDLDAAYDSAEIKQDSINTIISNPEAYFVDNIKAAALDYFFRFSVLEVGLSTQWENPAKVPPLMKSHQLANQNKVLQGDDKAVEDLEVPVAESVYFKHIPANRFRVSSADNRHLRNCIWSGYKFYIFRDTLENTKNIDFPSELMNGVNPRWSPEYMGPSRISGALRADAGKGEENDDLAYLIKNNEVTGVYKIWDNHTKEKLLIHEDSGHILWSEIDDVLGLATFRHIFRLRGWYPIPPVWYWISPQNEINEARQQMQHYRRRFKRKFAVLKSKVEPSEMDKLSSDIDGEVIVEKERESIRAISNPEIGISIQASLNLGYSDFNYVSGSSRVREGAEETATKTKISSTRERIRETYESDNFDNFVADIGRLALITLSQRGTLPLWIKYSSDPNETILSEVNIHDMYRRVFPSAIDDGYDFTLRLRIRDASPAQTEIELQKYITFMSLINQFPQIMLSPTLIRETAAKCGYRNLKVIREMQRTAQLYQMSQMAQMQQQMGGTGIAGNNTNNASRNAIENASPNPTNEIKNQLENQVGMGQ